MQLKNTYYYILSFESIKKFVSECIAHIQLKDYLLIFPPYLISMYNINNFYTPNDDFKFKKYCVM